MRFTILILMILFPLLAKADGSFYIDDIEPLLSQQPELWTSLKAGFDFRETGIAPRISVLDNKTLAGTRVSPYTIEAKPKGSSGLYIFTFEVRAKTHYYDSKGKEVTLEKAVTVKEELESIIIRKMSQDDIEIEAKVLKEMNGT